MTTIMVVQAEAVPAEEEVVQVPQGDAADVVAPDINFKVTL